MVFRTMLFNANLPYDTDYTLLGFASVGWMRIRVCVVGKARLDYAKRGIEEYTRRLPRNSFELVWVREGKSEQEAQRLLEASQGYYRIALDERGQRLGTLAFWQQMQTLEQQAVKGVAFLIGGANGHHPSLRSACQSSLSLSDFTLQHELALVVLLEQLYRLETLKRGEPYHRE